MSDDNSNRVDRREVLKMSAAATATAVGGVAAVGSGSASPNVSLDDYVEVDPGYYQHGAPTWDEWYCRGQTGDEGGPAAAESCAVSRRYSPDRGRAIAGPRGSARWHVRWDEVHGDPYQKYSWIDQQHLTVISRG